MRLIPSVPAITNYDYSFRNKSFIIITSLVISFLALVSFGAQSMQAEKDRCTSVGGHMDFVTKEIEDTSYDNPNSRYRNVGGMAEAYPTPPQTENMEAGEETATASSSPEKKTRKVQVLECISR